MFVNNTAKKEIKLRSFEGFRFTIPAGVSWIWDVAGEHLVTNIYKVEQSKTLNNKDKYGFDNGNGIPALLKSTEKAWWANGKQLTKVERFKINGKMIPRKELVKIAPQRGIPQARIFEYLADQSIDTTEIAEDINALPVPEEVSYPANLESPVPSMATV